MNRREAIQRTAIMMGGAISGSAMLGVMNGCKADPKIEWSPKYFNPKDGSLVEAVAERIIPQTDTPGSKAAGVPVFIDLMMAEYYTDKDKKTLKDGLDKIEAEAKSAGGSFASLPAEKQDAVLKKFDAEAYDKNRKEGEEQHFFRTLKELVVLGYFTSEAGATEFLKYEPAPGDYKGCIPYSEVGTAWAT